MNRKFALIIGNSVYDDKNLGCLATPGDDVELLGDVLRDPEIGAFNEVKTLVNEISTVVQRAIAYFFAKKGLQDLLVLYFSGHGVLDNQGRLYLAVKDTERDLPHGTAIPANFVTDLMDQSRSKRQVLILDCCYSGAFARGTKGIPGATVGTAAAFEGNGYGRVVLTATDSTQYAWEGDQVIGQPEKSVFAHYLINGLRSGEADRDNDGLITADELYDYVYERVVNETPKQTPGKWSYKQQGEIVIARNPHPIVEPAGLPPALKQAIESPFAKVREGAVHELDHLLHSSNKSLVLAAHAALEKLTNDDSRLVSAAAAEKLAVFAKSSEDKAGTDQNADITSSSTKRNQEQALLASQEKAEADQKATEEAKRLRLATEKRNAGEEKARSIGKLMSEAESHFKQNKLQEAIEAYKRILELDAGNDTAVRQLKRAERLFEQKAERATPLAKKRTHPRQASRRTLAIGLAAMAVVGIFVSWFFLLNADKVDKVDLAGQASSTKQEMLNQKLEAQEVHSETWAGATFRLALQAEQKGDEAFAEGNYEVAKQAYDEASVNFTNSMEQATENAAMAGAKLVELKRSIATVKRVMLRERTAAKKVGADSKASELYENALEKERAGDASFSKGKQSGFLAAQNSYADARDGYKKAREQVEFTTRLRHGAESAKNEMDGAKQEVPGHESDRSAIAEYQAAVKTESEGVSQFQAGDFLTSQSSFERATGLYRKASKSMSKKFKSKADSAKKFMLQAKRAIGEESYASAKYREASTKELAAENAYDDNNFGEAHGLYKSAHKLYSAVVQEAQEKIAQEKEKIQSSQREIQSLVDDIKGSLESEDIAGLATLLDLPEDEKRVWQRLFRVAEDIKVNEIIRENPRLSSTAAQIDLVFKMSYYNNTNNTREDRDWRVSLNLEVVDGKWNIISRK